MIEDKKYLQEKRDRTEVANEELRRGLAFEQKAHLKLRLPSAQKKWWKLWEK